jgi:hypothetical protein
MYYGKPSGQQQVTPMPKGISTYYVKPFQFSVEGGIGSEGGQTAYAHERDGKNKTVFKSTSGDPDDENVEYRQAAVTYSTCSALINLSACAFGENKFKPDGTLPGFISTVQPGHGGDDIGDCKTLVMGDGSSLDEITRITWQFQSRSPFKIVVLHYKGSIVPVLRSYGVVATKAAQDSENLARALDKINYVSEELAVPLAAVPAVFVRTYFSQPNGQFHEHYLPSIKCNLKISDQPDGDACNVAILLQSSEFSKVEGIADPSLTWRVSFQTLPNEGSWLIGSGTKAERIAQQIVGGSGAIYENREWNDAGAVGIQARSTTFMQTGLGYETTPTHSMISAGALAYGISNRSTLPGFQGRETQAGKRTRDGGAQPQQPQQHQMPAAPVKTPLTEPQTGPRGDAEPATGATEEGAAGPKGGKNAGRGRR